MKAHLAKVSLALLSAAFLLGCQEQGSAPVGPDGPQFDKPVGGVHGHGKDDEGGGGGGAVAAELDLADGMLTTGLDVTVRANKLGAGYTDFDHDIDMQFTDLGTCEGFKGTKSSKLPSPGEVTELVAELTGLVTAGFFTMQIDENSLGSPSGDNLLLVEFDGTFDDPLVGFTRIMLGSPFNQVDPVTVTQVGDAFVWTGPVVVWAHGVGGGGGVKSDRIIQCSGTGSDPNKVTATININP